MKKGKEKKMDKKFKFSEQPAKAKIVYGIVAGVLCVTAIIVGIVAAANRKDEIPNEDTNPPISDGNTDQTPSDNPNEEDEKKPEKLSFVSPTVGEISESHSSEIPVFSDTLGEWRLHTGIDITADEGTEVYATERGTVSRVYSDPLLGKTVEVTHDGGIVTRYSNLASEVSVKEGDSVASGALIGVIGDTSISELAEEPHLHFEMLVNGVSVNPLDYISEESKEASLGITEA